MNDGWLKSLLEKLPGSWQIGQGKALAFGHTPAADLPECTASRENEHRYIRGAAGVADREVVCEKDAANAWAWQDKGQAALSAAYLDQTEADARYVNVSGDVMSGDLDVTKSDAQIRLISTNAGNSQIKLYDDTDGGVILYAEDGGGQIARANTGGGYVEGIFGFSNTGATTLYELAGTGTRVVEASSAGLLSAANRQAWVWLSEDTFTGVTEFTKDSILTTTYDEYELVYTVDNMSTANAYPAFQFRAAGANKNGTVYYGGYAYGSNTGGGTGIIANGATFFQMSHATGNLNRSISGTLKLYRPAVARAANEILTLHMTLAQHRQGTDILGAFFGGGYLGTDAMDGFRIAASAGNLVGGTVRVYGRRKN